MVSTVSSTPIAGRVSVTSELSSSSAGSASQSPSRPGTSEAIKLLEAHALLEDGLEGSPVPFEMPGGFNHKIHSPSRPGTSETDQFLNSQGLLEEGTMGRGTPLAMPGRYLESPPNLALALVRERLLNQGRVSASSQGTGLPSVYDLDRLVRRFKQAVERLTGHNIEVPEHFYRDPEAEMASEVLSERVQEASPPQKGLLRGVMSKFFRLLSWK